MKKSTIVLLVALAMFLCGVGLTVYGVTAQKDVTDITSVEPIDAKEIKKIDIDVLASSVEIKPSDDDKIHITYKDAAFCKYMHTVKNGELKIECTDVIPHISFGISFNVTTSSKVILLVPDYMTADIDVELDAGSFLMQNVTAAGSVDVESDAGAIKLENVNGVKASLHTDVGSIKTKNCSFDAFNSESDVGNIDFEDLDSKNIAITNDVGNINGTLCGKIDDYTIDCDKDMGKCNISDRVGGERILRIESSVGNVNITFAE